jgi:hypothetical protein
MGIDRGNQTDSQFVLAPGQTGNALFSVARGRGNDSPVGTGYTYNLTIDELQAQNGAMAIPVRQYNLNFPSLSPSGVASGMSSVAASAPSGAAAGNSYVSAGKAAAVGGMSTQPNQLGSRRVNAQRAVNGQVVNQPVAAQQRTTQQQGTGAMVPASMNSRMSTATKPTSAVKPAAQTKPATANTPNSTTTPTKKTTPTATTTSR